MRFLEIIGRILEQERKGLCQLAGNEMGNVVANLPGNQSQEVPDSDSQQPFSSLSSLQREVDDTKCFQPLPIHKLKKSEDRTPSKRPVFCYCNGTFSPIHPGHVDTVVTAIEHLRVGMVTLVQN